MRIALDAMGSDAGATRPTVPPSAGDLIISELMANPDAVGDADGLPEFSIEVPRQKEHGDFSCNAAMLLAKRLRKNPREIAEALKKRLGNADGLIAHP